MKCDKFIRHFATWLPIVFLTMARKWAYNLLLKYLFEHTGTRKYLFYCGVLAIFH